MRSLYALTLASALLSASLNAQTSLPDSHAPIGVMGDHLHEQGEWMLSYRYMAMDMQGSLQGDRAISPDRIVTTVPNRFANPPMMPPTLRVVPTEMTSGMHMLGMMYAPSDRITLMAMLNFAEKEMDHITYQGPMGTNRLGGFTTKTSGLGDSRLALLYGLVNTAETVLVLNLGLSLPTGDVEQNGRILTPMNTRPSPRLPYPMQLGSGTYDLEPGLTYKGFHERLTWGSQAKYLIRLDENDEGYALGDTLTWSSWAGYRLNDRLSTSIRLTYSDQDSIDGIDPLIALPVQTANPDYQGGQRWDLGLGVNSIFPGGHRFSLEYSNTLDQDVNGVQMEMDHMLTVGYQLAF